MKKWKFAVIAALLVLMLGDILYWTGSFSLDTRLPAKRWGEMQLWYNDESTSMEEIPLDEADFGRLAAVLTTMPVTNRPKFSVISQPHFFLVLYDAGGNPITMTVVENGDIAVHLPNGSSRYYDSGHMLYHALLEMSNA